MAPVRTALGAHAEELHDADDQHNRRDDEPAEAREKKKAHHG